MQHRLSQLSAATFIVLCAFQVQAQSPSEGQRILAGPSLEQTTKWLRTNLSQLGNDEVIVKTETNARRVERYTIDKFNISKCIATVTTQEFWDETDFPAMKFTFELKNVDVGKTHISESFVAKDNTASKPSSTVYVYAIKGGPQMVREMQGTKRDQPLVQLRISHDTSAIKVLNAFQHAALLCGAPSVATSETQVAGRYGSATSKSYLDFGSDGSFKMDNQGTIAIGTYTAQGDTVTLKLPNGAIVRTYLNGSKLLFDSWLSIDRMGPVPVTTAQNALAAQGSAPSASATSLQSSASGGGMRNADVLKLVSAGLSDQVIATAIRQERLTAFDLSLDGLVALKTAKVPDAVISAMQERNASPKSTATAATASEPKPVPKYDATLTAPPKIEVPNACTGIESMGVYKNELMSAAQGGVVEWLAKIRNNTSVTKIVVFAWRDQYGQDKKAQVQLRGGDIASPRLDLTAPRIIAPVSNVRILSCQ